MPRVANVPEIDVDHTVSPSPRNSLGVKGTGEAGTVGAPIAVLNAVLDALEPFDVERLPMPISPEDVYNSV
jgi:carbon-monoxide dehydrogenase large subunit